MKENENKSSKSLFLYTALIFLVALLMIILSFFGQHRMDKLEETEQQAKTITERASLLSDQNLALTEQVTTLKDDKKTLETDLKAEQDNNKILTEQLNSTNEVVRGYNLLKNKKEKEAIEIVKEIKREVLSADTQVFYDEIMKNYEPEEDEQEIKTETEKTN